MGPRAGLRKLPPIAPIGALPLDLGLTTAMIACQDVFKAAALSAIPRVTEKAPPHHDLHSHAHWSRQ